MSTTTTAYMFGIPLPLDWWKRTAEQRAEHDRQFAEQLRAAASSGDRRAARILSLCGPQPAAQPTPQRWWQPVELLPGPRPSIIQICPSSGACGVAMFARNCEHYLRSVGFPIRTVAGLDDVPLSADRSRVILIQHEHGLWRDRPLDRLAKLTGRRLLFFHSPGVERLEPLVDGFCCMSPGMISSKKPVLVMPHPGVVPVEFDRSAERRSLGYDAYDRVIVASGFLNNMRRFPELIERILPVAVERNWLIHLIAPRHEKHDQHPQFRPAEDRLLRLLARHPANFRCTGSHQLHDRLSRLFASADLLWCYTEVPSLPYSSGVISDQWASGTRVVTVEKRQHSAVYGLPNVRYAPADLDGFAAAVTEEAARPVERHDGRQLGWTEAGAHLADFMVNRKTSKER
jgi:hypothetical protein